MTIELNGASLQEGVMDGLTLLEVYVGAERIWPTAVQITLGTGYEARGQFRAAMTDYGLDYMTATEIPFDIELVGTGSARGLFQDCSSLTSVPQMDTGNVTDMGLMFYGCSSLTSAPEMDTSKVTDMNSMFQDCSSLTLVPDMATSQVTNTTWMFYGCSALTDGNVRLLGRNPNVSTSFMISNSGLTSEPWYNADGTPILGMVQITLGTGYEARDQFRAALKDYGLTYQTVKELPFEIDLVGTGTTNAMFQGCSALKTAPAMYTGDVTKMSSMFQGCSALTYVPDMVTLRVTEAIGTFLGCSSLTDGNVRLIGKHPSLMAFNMIRDSGLTREPFYDTNGKPI